MPRACAGRVPEATGPYEPRDPAQSVLYHVVRDHFETFRAQAASLRDGEGLPRFVEREFREFLSAGVSPPDSRASTAMRAATIGWCRSRAKGAASVPVAAVAAWPNARRTSSIMCCPTSPFGNGC
jgi:hypothetical protein